MTARTHGFALLLAIALVAPRAASATPAEPPLAIVAAVSGRVDVTPAPRGPARRATFGEALARGDRIAVAPGGHLTVFFNDGNVVELGERSVMTISGRATTRARAGGAVGGEVYASVSRFVAGGSRESGLVGLTPLRAGTSTRPLVLRPRRTNLLDGRPAFTWAAVAGATRYQVTLSDDHGELWHRESGDTALAYPADAPALAAGADVQWEVRALGDRDELQREASVVHVLGGEDATGVRGALARIREAAGAGSAAARFLAGSYLFGEGLYVESADEFGALRTLEPASPAAHEALGNVFRAVGLPDRAAEEYRTALALSR